METQRLEQQARQRLESVKPGAVDPATPGLDDKASRDVKPKDKEKPTREEMKKIACPRAVNGQTCKFHDEGKCYYSHAEQLIKKAQAKAKPKAKSREASREPKSRKSKKQQQQQAAA